MLPFSGEMGGGGGGCISALDFRFGIAGLHFSYQVEGDSEPEEGG